MIIRGPNFGTKQEISQYQGNTQAPGQLVWCTDENRYYAMDGNKKGGYPMAKLEEVELFVTALENVILSFDATLPSSEDD